MSISALMSCFVIIRDKGIWGNKEDSVSVYCPCVHSDTCLLSPFAHAGNSMMQYNPFMMLSIAYLPPQFTELLHTSNLPHFFLCPRRKLWNYEFHD